MGSVGRREFLGGAGVLTLGLLAGCTGSSGRSSGRPRPAKAALSSPRNAPFDTVVVLMMENRSFDHVLGWFPGADGHQAGLSFLDAKGRARFTRPLAPDFQGCASYDPRHDWQSVARQYNAGRCDGWLQTQPVGDTFPIGYYRAQDLPITAALARHHTVCDRYFCSVMGPTGPNRMYAWCATTDFLEFNGLLTGEDPRPSRVQLAVWDRLHDAGVSGGYYAGKEPTSFQFASRKYDAITYSHAQFFDAARTGTLPNVSFLDPDLDSIGEALGRAYDDHPYADLRQGEAFVAKVYDALAHSPQWDRMVFVLTFDEHGGFFDHVAPPAVADDTVLAGPGPHPDLKRLGFRVPCIVMGPFGAPRVVHSGAYEHCSILRMIEWRWQLPPMTARDGNARNLAEALDFSVRRRPVTLPPFVARAPVECTPDQIRSHVTVST